MELFTLNCPNCGASLEVEDELDSFFCKYCGTKIILDGQSDAVVNAKASIKMQKEEHEHAKASEDAKFKRTLIMIGILVLYLVLFWTFMAIMIHRS